MSWTRLRRALAVRRKNARINSNVRAFIARATSQPRPSRETELRIEVLIPCYNHGRFVEDALASIPQDCPVTVVDDASTDDTPAILERLAMRYRFRVLRNATNLLQTGSLNRAVRESANNLFVVLNADDCLAPYTIDLHQKAFAAWPEVRLFGGGAIPFAGAPLVQFARALPQRLDYLPTARRFDVGVARSYRALNDLNLAMSGSAFLRSAWEAVGGFLPFENRVCSYDDRDFQMRVSCLFEVAVIDEPLSFYRTTSSLGRAEFVA